MIEKDNINAESTANVYEVIWCKSKGGIMNYIDPSKTMQHCIAALMGLDKYRFLLEQVHKVDVSSDEGFQRTFNGFYMVRRNKEWRKAFYDLFERVKLSNDVSFAYVLEELYRLTGNVEASFSSKLLATLKPEMPIWDRYVVQNLGLKLPLDSDPSRIQKTKEVFEEIVAWYEVFLQTKNARQCIDEFDKMLPGYSWLSDVKKIDFYLWSIRS